MKKLLMIPGLLMLTAMSVSAQRAINNNATEPYAGSNIQAQIRLNLDNNEKAVHFIRDNTDPYVITKIYVLKHADPYELRPYLRVLVQARKISQNNTVTECVKMNDGTGMVIISAEEDRFGAQPNGMGIDEIVAALDQPKITSSSGTVRFMYFPMYRSAAELQQMIYNVGMTHVNDPYELQQGNDKVAAESGTNALLFYVPLFSKKNIEEMLRQYDQPLLQATVKYTVYELYDEDDGKIGLDFQSWKNNDGVDLFSVGGRYRSNWSSTWSGGVAPQTGSNKTQFFNFNPKWNSKYLDFLVAKGQGQIMTSGEVVVKNNDSAIIDVTTNVFTDSLIQASDKNLTQYAAVTGTVYSAKQSSPTVVDYYFSATDSGGTAVTVAGGSFTGTLTAVKIVPPGNTSATRYQLAIEGGTLVKGGKDLGRQTDDITSFTLYQRSTVYSDDRTQNWYVWTAVAFTNDISIAKGNLVETVAGPGYGFNMTLLPQVNRDASILKVKLVNSSLIGWTSSGAPRIDRDGEVKTDISIGNDGNRFIVGGIDKRAIVRSVSGIPWLRELPGLGWIFGTESESTKRSQLVVVGECRLSMVKEQLNPELDQLVKGNKSALQKAGETNSWGFQQYWLDSNKAAQPAAKPAAVQPAPVK